MLIKMNLFTGTIPDQPPVKLNPDVSLVAPFHLGDFIKANREEIDNVGFIKLFQRTDYTHQFQVYSKYIKL